MVSLLVPTLNISETESQALQALIWVALVYFIVAIISIVWNAIPAIPWYWWPVETIQIDIGDNIGELLPSEKENKTGKPGRFKTLAALRSDTEFSLKAALDEYHSNPILYPNALEELGKEVCEVTYQKSATEYRALLAKDRIRQQRFHHMIDGVEGTIMFMSLRELFMPVLVRKLIGESKSPDASTTVMWIEEFERFRKNVNNLCRNIGSEVGEHTTLQETIQNLRRYAADGKRLLSPLHTVNAQLSRDLESYRRIKTALQIRHTIERLVFEAGKANARYKGLNAGPKWRIFWDDVWKDAETNHENPFYHTFVAANGTYDKADLKRKGLDLFKDMSQAIHWYDRSDLECEYFDYATKRIATVLCPTEIDDETGDVRWDLEIQKYPIKAAEMPRYVASAESPIDGSVVVEPRAVDYSSPAGFSVDSEDIARTLSDDSSAGIILDSSRELAAHEAFGAHEASDVVQADAIISAVSSDSTSNDVESCSEEHLSDDAGEESTSDYTPGLERIYHIAGLSTKMV